VPQSWPECLHGNVACLKRSKDESSGDKGLDEEPVADQCDGAVPTDDDLIIVHEIIDTHGLTLWQVGPDRRLLFRP